MKTKLLHILYSGLGGHGNVVFSLIEADSNNEFETSLLFYGVEDVKPDYLEYCRKQTIPQASVVKKEGKHLGSWCEVYRTLLRAKPDVILLHSITLVLPVFFYSMFNRVKVIAVEHNANSIKRNSEWLWSFLSMYLTSTVVYLSELYKTEVKNKFGFFFKESRTAVIPNGINTEKFKPQSTTASVNAPFKIVMLSRFTPLRNHIELIRVVAELVSEGCSLELVLAGDGITFQEVEAYSSGYEFVKLPGNLNEDAVIQLLQNADVYVHYSLAETMSTSILQALSCGLPVIASNIPGINNLKGSRIELFNSNQELRKMLLKYQKMSAPELARIRQENRAIAVFNYSNYQTFNTYKDIISSL